MGSVFKNGSHFFFIFQTRFHGEILKCLQKDFKDADLEGYDISPQALQLSKTRENEHLKFYLGDGFDNQKHFDLGLAIDVFEHVEDFFDFIRKMKQVAQYKLFHIPLEMTVQSVLREKCFLHNRESVGHIHYFNKSTAIASLKETGHQIKDCFYTPVYTVHSPEKPLSLMARLIKIPRFLGH